MSQRARAKCRCEKILQAGVELFLQNGYDSTSLQDIVRLSGGSLSTIYKYFGSKEGLFKQIIADEISKVFENIGENADSARTLEEFLFKFGVSFVRGFVSVQTRQYIRLITHESVKFQMLDYEFGIQKFRQLLAEKFIKFEEFRDFGAEHIEKFVLIYISALKEPFFERMLFLGDDAMPSAKFIEAHVKFVTNMSLNGILNFKKE